MNSQLLNFATSTIALAFALNLTANAILNFGIYYRRYHDKELAISASLFNVFAFCVLTALSSVNFGMASGFGLFAILAMFTMRSEPLSKTEITYLFGSVAIAVLCSVTGSNLVISAGLVGLVLVAVYALDHPRLLSSAGSAKITFDRIDPELLKNPEAMKLALTERLGVTVLNHQITQVDYINDMVKINVFYRNGGANV
jgi:Domain of unknown function (DUF4956)